MAEYDLQAGQYKLGTSGIGIGGSISSGVGISSVGGLSSVGAMPASSTWYYGQPAVSLDEKAKSVLLALVKHVDQHGYVHLEEVDGELDATDTTDDNALLTHAIGVDETFDEWVDRLYTELCVVRGTRAI